MSNLYVYAEEITVGLLIIAGAIVAFGLYMSALTKWRKRIERKLLQVFREEYGYTPTAEEFRDWLNPEPLSREDS